MAAPKRPAGGGEPPESTQSGPSNGTYDIYRTLASAVQKPLAPFLPSDPTPPPISTLLSLDPTTYSHRVSGRNLFLDGPDAGPSGPSGFSGLGGTNGYSGVSPLVTGRKRNRGNPELQAIARAEVEEKDKQRKENGLVGLRKVRKRLGGVVRRRDEIEYNSLLPLHQLHTLYLTRLLSLPPLPNPLPTPLPSLPSGLSPEVMSTKLSKADFTGIHLFILSSRNPSLVGISGLVIEETASTFRLVSKDNLVRIIPKDGTQFKLSFPGYAPTRSEPGDKRSPTTTRPTSASASTSPTPVETRGSPEPLDIAHHLSMSPRIEFTLLGTNFKYRSADRAGRKYRLAQGEGGGNGWGEHWVVGDWAVLEEDFNTIFTQRSSLNLKGSGSGRGEGKNDRRTTREIPGATTEKGVGAAGRRKRNKSRRKDLPAGASLQVFF